MKLHEKTVEVIEMNENICKIEAKGFQDLCNHIRDLEEKNKTLEKHNRLLSDELTYFKERCIDLEEEVNDLHSENVHFKAKNLAMSKRLNYLTSAEAGRDFARSLLGKPMTQADIEEDKAIADGEAHYERTWNLNGGDDF